MIVKVVNIRRAYRLLNLPSFAVGCLNLTLLLNLHAVAQSNAIAKKQIAAKGSVGSKYPHKAPISQIKARLQLLYIDFRILNIA